MRVSISKHFSARKSFSIFTSACMKDGAKTNDSSVSSSGRCAENACKGDALDYHNRQEQVLSFFWYIEEVRWFMRALRPLLFLLLIVFTFSALAQQTGAIRGK